MTTGAISTYARTDRIGGIAGLAVRAGHALEDWGRRIAEPATREQLEQRIAIERGGPRGRHRPRRRARRRVSAAALTCPPSRSPSPTSGSTTCGRGSPRTRFAEPSSPEYWKAGVDPDYLRSLVAYWADEFDWRAAEARLNAYPQFIERGMHFVHIRRDPTRPPVLLTHGWPSTFLELLPLADLLDVDVVIPSLPGYLYSDLLDVPMTRAGHRRELPRAHDRDPRLRALLRVRRRHRRLGVRLARDHASG